MNEQLLRDGIVETSRRLSADGLSPGRSGNVSARFNGGMLITPSGLPYDVMSRNDIVFVDREGMPSGDLKPSSEWQFHLGTYLKRADVMAHVHTHSLNATILASAHKPIPAFHYMVAVAGGDDIPLVDYATFGSEELAANVAGGLANRNACLIANHGLCAVGHSLDAAYELAAEVETLAAQYVKLLELGEVHLLPAAEMERVLELFKTYGQPPRNEDAGG